MIISSAVLLSTWYLGSSTPTERTACACHNASCIQSVSLLQFKTTLVKGIPHEGSYTAEDYEKGFHCDEGLEEWRRGWSWIKMQWCCDKEGIACDLISGTAHVPETRGGLMDSELKLTEGIDIVVAVETSSEPNANTSSGASVAFQIGPDWTEEMELCTEASPQVVTARMIRLPSWPQKMRFRALGNDSWGYLAINLYFTDRQNNTMKVVVLNSTNTDHANQFGSRYWLDGGGEAPSEHTYLVPELQADSQPHMPCTTRDDPRAHRMTFETAPAGTPCVFGVVDADEGSHCIYDDGQYGSFGWCYTSEDKSIWGSCSEDCPLTGQFKILGTKVDEVLRRLKRIKVPVPPQAKVTATTNQTARASNRSSTTTTAAPTSAAAVLRQLAPVERHGR